MINELQKYGTVTEHASLKNMNTYHIDGKAKILIEPNTIEDVVNILKTLREYKEPYFLLGNGSNIVLNDKEIDGVVIRFNKLNKIEVNKASKKLTYNVGETFSIEDVAVIAQYEDGIKEKLDKQYKVEVQGGNKLSTPGEKEVIVTYGDVTTKFRINVEEGTTNESKSTMNIFIVLGVVLVVFITILVTLVRKKDKLNNQQKIKD